MEEVVCEAWPAHDKYPIPSYLHGWAPVPDDELCCSQELSVARKLSCIHEWQPGPGWNLPCLVNAPAQSSSRCFLRMKILVPLQPGTWTSVTLTVVFYLLGVSIFWWTHELEHYLSDEVMAINKSTLGSATANHSTSSATRSASKPKALPGWLETETGPWTSWGWLEKWSGPSGLVQIFLRVGHGFVEPRWSDQTETKQ